MPVLAIYSDTPLFGSLPYSCYDLRVSQVPNLPYYTLQVEPKRELPSQAAQALRGSLFNKHGRHAPEDLLAHTEKRAASMVQLMTVDPNVVPGKTALVKIGFFLEQASLGDLRQALLERQFPALYVGVTSSKQMRRFLLSHQLRSESDRTLVYQHQPDFHPIPVMEVREKLLPRQEQIVPGGTGLDRLMRMLEQPLVWEDDPTLFFLAPIEQGTLTAPLAIAPLPEDNGVLARMSIELGVLFAPMLSPEIAVHLYHATLYSVLYYLFYNRLARQEEVIGLIRKWKYYHMVLAATLCRHLSEEYLHAVVARHRARMLRVAPDIVVPYLLTHRRRRASHQALWQDLTAWRKIHSTTSALKALQYLNSEQGEVCQ